MKLSSLTLSGLFASCFLFCEEGFSLVIEASTNEENSSESNLDEESHRHLLEEIVSDSTFKNNVKREDTSVVQKSRHLQQTPMLINWVQQGNTVSANRYCSSREGFGKSVALSRNGKTLVVGAPEANNEDGKIEIYKFTNSQWNLVQTISGDAAAGIILKGNSVSMNPNGKHIAVHNQGSTADLEGNMADGGSFSVYEYDIGTATYLPLGSTMKEVSSDGYYYNSFGRGIEISRNGKRVALGSPDAVGMQGRAYVYEYNSVVNDWQIIFETTGLPMSNLGTDVSLAKNGESVAVVTNPGNGSPSACSVDVWKEDSSSNWVKTSLPLTNSVCSGAYLNGLSMSDDGMRIALADSFLNNIGGTYVFDKVGPDWVLDSNTPLMGEGRHPNGDYCGREVVISADGSKLAMACTGAGGNDDGYAIVFEVDGTGNWSQAGLIILTTPSEWGEPRVGSRVASVDIALRQDGRTRVAVGSDTVTTLSPIGSAAVHELMSIPCIDSNAEMRMNTMDSTMLMDETPFFCKWFNRGQGSTCAPFGQLVHHCPQSCGTCGDHMCSDSTATFVVNGYKTSCTDYEIGQKCSSVKKIRNTCRQTCGYCGSMNPMPPTPS